MLTKAQIRSAIRMQMPDAEKQLWSDGQLDVITQLVIDELYSEVLDEAPWFTSYLETIATTELTSPGYVDLGASGPLAKRFYRLQKLTRDNQEFSPTHPRDFVTFQNQDVSSERFTYSIMGGQLWAFPLSTSCTIELRYSYLPAVYTGLADSASVEWPTGFETVFIYETLARSVFDSDLATKFHSISEVAFQRLKSRTRREYVGPAVMLTTDSPLEVGGT